MDKKQFWSLIIGLILTNAHFHSAISVLEKNDSTQDYRIEKLENLFLVNLERKTR